MLREPFPKQFVIIKMLLGYLFCISSERRLVKECSGQFKPDTFFSASRS